MDVVCQCGNNTFHLKEKTKISGFLAYKLAILESELTCTRKCHGETESNTGVFLTSILIANKDGSSSDTHQEEKACPKCKGKEFKATVIERLLPSTVEGGSWYGDLSEFTHRLSCANPECPWTLESIARSIHAPHISREDLILTIAQAIQEKFTELRKSEMKWTEDEHPCIRPWDQLSDDDKRLPLLYAETALDLLDQFT